jgi:hypothetical protein
MPIMKSIPLQGRAAQGPQFAKVYVRIVDWAVAEQSFGAAASPSYRHPSWHDSFVLVELPLQGTVEDLTVVSTCRWGGGVIPYGCMYLANSGGRILSWTQDSAGDCTTVDNALADELVPLHPQCTVASIPRFELPMSFVLMSRPSSFVPRAVVCSVLQRLQDDVIAEKEAPLLAFQEERRRRKELDELRKVRIAELEVAQQRREVLAVLQSHQKEEMRLVQMHPLK